MSTEAGAAASRIIPVILSGGSGTRLWPLSRKATPKQMLPLIGARSMLQMTAERVGDDALFATPIVVAAEHQAQAIALDFEAAGRARPRLILEPAARNTAPAIALAAFASDPEALLLVMPSDHLIADPAGFSAAVQAARPAADAGWLVTFGVTPSHPETGYGYIRRGDRLPTGQFRADRFVEKPDAATAAAYLAEGCFDWNAGIFLFKAGAYLQALTEHAPDIEAAVRHALKDMTAADADPLCPDAARFALVRSQSIDHAVMEHAANVAVVPIDVGWSDVGSWQSLHEASIKDADGNVLFGEVEALGSTNCLLRSGGPMVVAIGLDNIAVIATDDAVLVVAKDHSQRVSEVVARLSARGDSRL
ncbi:MAG TPA: mannose-1-phosphate guanylyltransferase/mannose-6-phosphate isomerase [Allosphingosinicella sp.]|jgi:mannose-1-phosphate guanylyltransferase/mannose-1-phosphate guanylyltransferase/mannose-6-phosphate isomerase